MRKLHAGNYSKDLSHFSGFADQGIVFTLNLWKGPGNSLFLAAFKLNVIAT